MKTNLNILKKKNGYDWQFSNVGGVMRVDIASGEDIAHLHELDQKMWTILSCPANGLELDAKTLAWLDSDHDGKIRVDEVVAAARWLTSLLNDPDLLLKRKDTLPISALNIETEEGRAILYAICQILTDLGNEKACLPTADTQNSIERFNIASLEKTTCEDKNIMTADGEEKECKTLTHSEILNDFGIEQDYISIADTQNSIDRFNKTPFNGDGVITENSTEDEAIKLLIRNIIECVGSVEDRSGEAGVNKEQADDFYAQCRAYQAWYDEGEHHADTIFPYGKENTPEAIALFQKLKEKIDDYFLRCELVRFNEAAQETLDVSVAQMENIGDKNLVHCTEEIANYPLARINKNIKLDLSAPVNPAWQQDFARFDELVLKHHIPETHFPGQRTMEKNEWNKICQSFAVYMDWASRKAGQAVESLGIERIREIVEQNRQAEIMDLIDRDLAMEKEGEAIEKVDKLLHLYRDFYTLLKNFVTLSDFYDREQQTKAIFQAGTLYIDQRSCDLCLKVNDMAKHNASAGLSGMFLIYCDCFSKTKNETMQIVAVLTNGEINDIVVGKNALFYDRNGLDWDAKITKIIENPISIKEAFWSPYRKFARFIENQINKIASAQDEKVSANVTNKITDATQQVTVNLEDAKLKKETTQSFDIAKYCGIFAAIGLAVGTIGTALVAAFKAFFDLDWWKMPFVILGLMLVISGPSMLLAAMKLRKRNLAPILDANGWAVNAKSIVSIPFGYTLTNMADFPKIKLDDPFDKRKKMPVWKRILYILLIFAVIFAALYFTNLLAAIGLPCIFIK